ncbi:Oidioi.mRNA.OKI2018_I69.chrUn_7.g17248.t1.cds [Oikopleura dioica]|uniref:Oidioi.mRNA.OKI2018_I69.chrUn_7.g17248.t1.c ds n=1 Tax=Oikopleura dioica TaxID=34765 RepID=A0ABN7TDS7_OIKDI|nr:Oidioi.mRNA.OKI2018_I69.chrUn_7.g17248.t1.cds [Oikopleura dioica]
MIIYQDFYDEDSFDSAISNSTKSVDEELKFCDLAASSTLDCYDDVVKKSSLNGLFNLLEQVLIAEIFQEIISCLEEFLLRARIEEQLLEIADGRRELDESGRQLERTKPRPRAAPEIGNDAGMD